MTDNFSPINEEWEDDLCHSSLGSTAITAGKANMDRRMSHDLDSIVDHNGNYTDGKNNRYNLIITQMSISNTF